MGIKGGKLDGNRWQHAGQEMRVKDEQNPGAPEALLRSLIVFTIGKTAIWQYVLGKFLRLEPARAIGERENQSDDKQ